MSDLINSFLPEEIVRDIFRLMPKQDLCKALLVCTKWRDVGEDPTLWSWGMLEVNNGDLEMLGTRRIQYVLMISLGGEWDSLQLEKLFQTLVQLNKLNTLFMYSLDLNDLEPGLLALNVN